MNLNTNRHTQRGFTLIEVMVVVVILGILAAFIVPKLMDRPDAARVVKVKNDIRVLELQLGLYRLDNRRDPSTDEGLEALIHKPDNAPSWKEGGYLDRLPMDPWGKSYQYLSPGVHGAIDIFSYGADGAEGGDGDNADVGNWNIE